jgi:hypothetical protein
MEPSRRKPQPGDVFAMQLPDDQYVLGRVIRNDAMASWSGQRVVLVYVLGPVRESMRLPDRVELLPPNLLIPPLMTNRLPWSRGYFKTLGNVPIRPGEVLDRHCFETSSGRFYDEYLNELPGRIEPCSHWGLHSYRTIDDAISRAIGIPSAPEG